jgi:hypothetical protein
VTVTEVAATVPKNTWGFEAKFVPLMFTLVPPVVRPVLGETLVTVGAGAKRKAPVSVAVWLSGFLTSTSTKPAAWAGVTASISVELTTTTAAAATPPKTTPAPGTKFVPISITEVPPAAGPEIGETLLNVVAGARVYVKALVRVPSWLSGFRTMRSTGPAVCPGVMTRSWVELTTFTDVAAAPPNKTMAFDWKFAPVIVTLVPPEEGPELGETEVILGGGTAMKLKAFRRAPLWPSGFLTCTSVFPGVCGAVTA